MDLAISFDGYSLLSEGNAFAYTGAAGNGDFDLAIAYGDYANAFATGGTGDYALADGASALAESGGDVNDTGANYDSAIDIGNNDAPSAGNLVDGLSIGYSR